MTDFWKSNPKKQCEFCKCWIADNKASIEFHEKGKNHKENVKRRLAQVKKKAVEKRKADETFSKEFAAMEAAALKAVKKDLLIDPGIVGTSDLKVLVKDSNRTQDTIPENSTTTWITCQAPQGYTYYYNQITGESQWEKPTELDVEVTAKEKESEPKKDRDSSTKNDPYRSESNNKHPKEEENEKHPLLGGWTTISNYPKESSCTLKGNEDNPPEAVVKDDIDKTADKEEQTSTNPESLSTESRKRTAIFKEKEVKSLGNNFLDENVGFKKRKIKNNRNARKRDNDED